MTGNRANGISGAGSDRNRRNNLRLPSLFDEKPVLNDAIRWGMVGGGRNSQVGYSHRTAATRDGLFRLLAGAFDKVPEYGIAFGRDLGLDEQRCYPDYRSMFAAENGRTDGIQAVTIATPNNKHYEIGMAALEAGLHVICEKPLTTSLHEAEKLNELARKRRLVAAVMYGYAGYQMIHQARAMATAGELGDIRIINMEFAHGYHAEAVEQTDPRVRWLVTPDVAGPSYVLADLGIHVFYLATLITGLKVRELCCTRQSFVKTRAPLEDNAHVLMHFNNGAVGTLWASAVNSGSNHGQKLRVVGSRASIEWWDEHPNQLLYAVQGEPVRVLDRGHAYLHQDARFDRVPSGHPEGFFESWANLYQRYALVIDAARRGDDTLSQSIWYPDIAAGIEGVRLVERCVESADNGCQWVAF